MSNFGQNDSLIKEAMSVLGKRSAEVNGEKRDYSGMGKNAAANMTPEQRKERARKASAKRWDKHKPIV